MKISGSVVVATTSRWKLRICELRLDRFLSGGALEVVGRSRPDGLLLLLREGKWCGVIQVKVGVEVDQTDG